MVLDGTIAAPKPAELSFLVSWSADSASRFCFRRQKKNAAEAIAARATRPIVNPTAPPVPSPLLPFDDVTGTVLEGDVGVGLGEAVTRTVSV